MRLHGGQQRIEPALCQRPHLLERAGGEHGLEPGIDAAVEFGAIGGEKHPHGRGRIDQRRQAVPVPVGERASGRQHDLEGAGDAHAVVRLEPRGRGRIVACEFPMKRGRPLGRKPVAHRARISAGTGGTAARPAVSALK